MGYGIERAIYAFIIILKQSYFSHIDIKRWWNDLFKILLWWAIIVLHKSYLQSSLYSLKGREFIQVLRSCCNPLWDYVVRLCVRIILLFYFDTIKHNNVIANAVNLIRLIQNVKSFMQCLLYFVLLSHGCNQHIYFDSGKSRLSADCKMFTQCLCYVYILFFLCNQHI